MPASAKPSRSSSPSAPASQAQSQSRGHGNEKQPSGLSADAPAFVPRTEEQKRADEEKARKEREIKAYWERMEKAEGFEDDDEFLGPDFK
jgi:hypothetical protein